MSSFNDINGLPVTGSRKYLTEILREKLGFDGFVVSDWGAVNQLEHMGFAENRVKCAELALNAGIDLDMCDYCYTDFLEKLVKDGKIFEETIDLAVSRILCIKLALNLFQYPYGEKNAYDKEKHLKDARELATESMVLLKNNGVLPLSKNSKIALAGPFARERRSLLGTWTLDGREDETTNFYEAISEVLTEGQLFCQDESGIFDNSVAIATKADVVVLALGESHLATGERNSVADISLSESQILLINKMKAFQSINNQNRTIVTM